ncbi:hypothetical protein EVAR_96821_1 [Eumeta japonica]|uniref:Uncharacterized protein n=1 Tax=Eumeta variegata TaxID=151549 RepID=A0A4C1WCM7_EUMVA|nr:hypothetical protein EVAR_96821_1 [Eumeta japonica]
MTHCRVPLEPSVRARARTERSLFHSIGRCDQVEERDSGRTQPTRELFCQLFIKSVTVITIESWIGIGTNSEIAIEIDKTTQNRD